jgi:glycosyltransferase involved in cell wall biosynthesis
VGVAIEVCQHLNKQLIIAGQGSLQDLGYSQCPDHVKLVGYADPAMRKLLMSKAQALFIASSYSEPFAGVQCEAWLSGTPVISPDYAAFAELNIDGVTGYRCRTFKDYVRAVENVSKGLINYEDCHKHGQKFTYSAIKPQYQRYFQDVLNVYTGKGWYEL